MRPLVGIALTDILRSTYGGFLAGGFATALCFGVKTQLDFDKMVALPAGILLFAASYVLALWVVDRSFFEEVRVVMRQAVSEKSGA